MPDELVFPPPEAAEPDGLLAIGGDLSIERVLLAYQCGIFPWYTEDSPILWWSPDPRLVLYPEDLVISRSLLKAIKKGTFTVTLDTAFEDVIRGCAEQKRRGQQGTWIVEDMITAYCRLHEQGFAHSVESWYQGALAGGLYGVALGRIFFGESMFYRVKNASKVAFVHLVQLLRAWEFDLIDCQVYTSHLHHFGALEISRNEYLDRLRNSLSGDTQPGRWSFPGSFHPMPTPSRSS
ncbi:MAG TPA: leucyl/phenylalanyl-tRNA--protein transferase [Thermodesulfobacteriota bacterium]|nr:leucyl/phenylalanyl-tRNA--protein transferase [Thermodesulfobacteriota bacterium]